MQLKARARITLKPLVETIPCLGAVNISLLEVPTVDLALSIINSLDLMAIPGLNLAVNLGLKMVSFLPWLSCFCNSVSLNHPTQEGLQNGSVNLYCAPACEKGPYSLSYSWVFACQS